MKKQIPSILTLVVLLCVFFTNGFSQRSVNTEKELITPEMEKPHNIQDSKAGVGDFKTIDPASIYYSEEWPDAEKNFNPSGFSYLGDINGDGYDDMYYNTGKCGDESTSDIMDFTYKSVIKYGSADQNFNDTIINCFIYPIGDINGDGYDDVIKEFTDNTWQYALGSESGLVESGEAMSSAFPNAVVTCRDIDQDDYQDMITNNGNTFTIYFGAANISDIQSKEYASVEFSQINNLFAEQVKGNKMKILLFVRGEWDTDNSQYIRKLIHTELDASRNLSIIDQDTINDIDTWNPTPNNAIVDLNGDGFKEAIYYNSQGKVNALFEDGSTGEYSDAPTAVYDGDIKFVGDINSDSKGDFIVQTGGNEYLAWYSETDGEIIPQENLGILDETYSPSGFMGDVDGDGIEDFNFFVTKETQEGSRTYFGNSSNNFNYTESLRNVPQKEDIKEVVNLGDLNGDEKEDLAYLTDEKVMIFTDKLDEIPELTIESSGQYYNQSYDIIIGGDFNGDGYSDIALYEEVQDENDENYNTSIQLFYGGSDINDTPDHTIYFNADLGMPSNTTDGMGVRKIGDINDDGVQDFMLYGDGDMFIFYGGSSIDKKPDMTIDANKEYVGSRTEALGDINEDGIDDFAVSDFKNTSVYVYFGKGSSGSESDYQEPDLTMAPDGSLSDNSISDFGFSLTSGDYNGDGITDIAAMPYNFQESSDNTQGIKGLHVFYGGASMDTIADELLKLPAEPFGGPSDVFVSRTATEFSTIPDINSDGSDELYVSGGWYSTNPNTGDTYSTYDGIVLQGGDYLNQDSIPTMRFNGANIDEFGPKNSYLFTDRNSPVGDFNRDGQDEILIIQNNLTFAGTSVYEFPLGDKDNSSPVCEDATFSVKENASNGTTVGEVTANDPDGDPLTFSIVEGNTGDAFALDSATITVNDSTQLDYETNPTFTLKVEASDGSLEDTATVEINLDEATAINYKDDSRISIYPNPTSDKLNIEFNNDTGKDLQISIVSMDGKVEYNNKIEKPGIETRKSLDLSELSGGIYMLRLKSGKTVKTERLIIE